MDITFKNLKKAGFESWDESDPSSNWLLDSEPGYDFKENLWKPCYRITICPMGNRWDCTAWYNNETDKKRKTFRKVEVTDIITMEDIQKVIDILGVERNIL